MSDSPSYDGSKSKNGSPRWRRPTFLHLSWLAERLRRYERVRTEVSSGMYKPDSGKVAAALLNKDA